MHIDHAQATSKAHSTNPSPTSASGASIVRPDSPPHPVPCPTLPNGHCDVVYDWPLPETWKGMAAVVKKGKVRAIGVSNCSERVLENEILPYAQIVPAVDQVELHLYNPQHKFLAYLKSKDIVPMHTRPWFRRVAAPQGRGRGGDRGQAWACGRGRAAGMAGRERNRHAAEVSDAYAHIEDALAVSKKQTPEDIEKLNGVVALGKEVRLI
ncbi:NADP-dependent oxidoreductase domain-containing protein [Ganoderma leucocontextum]|nr:NADP-dependent oxidoreductase domain-containing protein [Ganoderma leucocontextum]